MAGIFVALYRIMVVLTGSVSKMMKQFQEVQAATGGGGKGGISAGSALGGMSMFTNFPEQLMLVFVVNTLIIITVSNIIAARIVGGGDRYMFYFYTAIFCSLTGLVLLVTPMVVGIFFSPEGLTSMTGAGQAMAGGV
jgi:flagellar protein FlaJ